MTYFILQTSICVTYFHLHSGICMTYFILQTSICVTYLYLHSGICTTYTWHILYLILPCKDLPWENALVSAPVLLVGAGKVTNNCDRPLHSTSWANLKPPWHWAWTVPLSWRSFIALTGEQYKTPPVNKNRHQRQHRKLVYTWYKCMHYNKSPSIYLILYFFLHTSKHISYYTW